MDEIKKSGMSSFNNPVQRAKAPEESNKEQTPNLPVSNYKDEVAPQGADAAGRAMLGINMPKSTDNIESDIDKIIKNPDIVNTSDAMFNAALMAGASYPQAATFATGK